MFWQPVSYSCAGTVLTAHMYGEGVPLILLHGSGLDDHRTFDGLAVALADGYMALAVDVRGYGLSRCADARLHTWDQYARDVVALLDHLTLQTAVVGGYSLGAGIALATAVRFPDRVAALLLGCPAYAGTDKGLTVRQRVHWEQARAQVLSVRRVGLRSTVAAMHGGQVLDPLTEQRLATQDDKSLLAALEGELATAQPFDSEDQLRAVAAPALIIPGQDDAHDPLIADLYARCLRRATTVAGGSMSPIGDPPEVRSFLDLAVGRRR